MEIEQALKTALKFLGFGAEQGSYNLPPLTDALAFWMLREVTTHGYLPTLKATAWENGWKVTIRWFVEAGKLGEVEAESTDPARAIVQAVVALAEEPVAVAAK